MIFPPTESARPTAIPENVCYYPPPPLNLPGLRRSRKISATTPPPTESGRPPEITENWPPPKKKSWLRRCLERIQLCVNVLRDIFVDVPPQALNALVVDGTPSHVRTMAQPPDDVHQEGDQRVLHPVIAAHTTGQSKLRHSTCKELNNHRSSVRCRTPQICDAPRVSIYAPVCRYSPTATARCVSTLHVFPSLTNFYKTHPNQLIAKTSQS